MSVSDLAPPSPPGAWVSWAIGGASALVLGAVAAVTLRASSVPGAPVPGSLATVNAALNLLASVLLACGFAAIRRRRIAAHRAFMLAAVAVSALFLVGYVLHHASVGSVRFQGEGAIRVVYFGILIPHVVLAAPVLPLALVTLSRGVRGDHPRHRAIARVTLPLWWFVSASGVLIYLLLYGIGASSGAASPGGAP